MVARRQLIGGALLTPMLASATAPDRASSRFDPINVGDFGARGDGVTDDSEAVQRALEACADGRLLLVPQGRFLIRKPLRATGLTNLAGYSAEASEFVFDASGALIYQGTEANDFDSRSQVTVRNIGFRCMKTRVRSAPVLALQFQGGRGGTTKSALLEDVEVSGLTEGAGFDCALKLVNARNLKIDGMRIRGDREARSGTIGIDIGGEDSPVDSFVTKISCYFLERGINITGTVEGVYLSQSVFVAVDHGIYAHVPSPTPLLFVENCHINAFVSCIDVSNLVQFDFSHNLLYASKPRKALPTGIAKSGFVAIAVGMHENIGLTSRIAGNTVVGTTEIGIPKNGIYVDGEKAEFSLSIDGNELVGWDTGVILGKGSRGVMVAANNRFRSNRNDVLDMGGANVVSEQKYTGNDGYSRNENGLETKWGISTVDFQTGRGKVVFAPPFKSSFLFGLCTNGDSNSLGRIFILVDSLRSTNSEMQLQTEPGHTGSLTIQWIAIGR